MSADYAGAVAAATGLRHYPKQGPFVKKTGAAIGARDSYLVAIGLGQNQNRKVVGILVRFRKTDHPELLKGIAKSPAMQSCAKKGRLAASGADFVRWEWGYSFGKPKAEEIALLLSALVEALKPMVSGLDGRCEHCQSSGTLEMLLMNRAPAYICENCQQKIRAELDAAAVAYDQKTSNLPNGVFLGVAAALAGALAWGGVAYAVHYIFLYGAIVIGYFIAWAVIRGMGKINLAGQLMIAVLTVASVLLGDALFFTFSVMKETGRSFSLNLLGLVLNHFWELESKGSGPLSIFFALVGAGYAIWRARKPKFKLAFEKLGAPAG